MGRGATVRRMLAAAAVVVLVAGCGSYSDRTPTAGVDELVIPTPSPDPDDFVAAIDNPWLHLTNGEGGPTISGVATTAVTTDGVVDYYAQDEEGNVWWFGREGEWQAGEDGAEAGIKMLAKPRVGDGYAEMGVDGEPGQRSVVKELNDDDLVIETTTATGDVLLNHYERGVGLVLLERH